jgi:hypothetical protein
LGVNQALQLCKTTLKSIPTKLTPRLLFAVSGFHKTRWFRCLAKAVIAVKIEFLILETNVLLN